MGMQSHTVHTAMGKVAHYNQPHPLGYILSQLEQDELDSIGYSKKTLDGTRTDRETYLNSLGKGEFGVHQIKRDTGDFAEAFTITHYHAT